MVRSILSIAAGLVVAFVVVIVLEIIGHTIYPPPPGIDLHDPEAMKTIIDKLPRGALIFVLVAWGLGTFAGSLTAALLARRAHSVHAAIVGGIQFLAGWVTMVMIPHPDWFFFTAVALFPIASVSAGLLAEQLSRPADAAASR